MDKIQFLVLKLPVYVCVCVCVCIYIYKPVGFKVLWQSNSVFKYILMEIRTSENLMSFLITTRGKHSTELF